MVSRLDGQSHAGQGCWVEECPRACIVFWSLVRAARELWAEAASCSALPSLIPCPHRQLSHTAMADRALSVGTAVGALPTCVAMVRCAASLSPSSSPTLRCSVATAASSLAWLASYPAMVACHESFCAARASAASCSTCRVGSDSHCCSHCGRHPIPQGAGTWSPAGPVPSHRWPPSPVRRCGCYALPAAARGYPHAASAPPPAAASSPTLPGAAPRLWSGPAACQ